jgi:exopolyphosphatase/guanosine-5'-triphosphate,3'-diphosphate pyrophosphatase
MTAVSSAPVAVIDIGSNSIKALVARRGADGGLKEISSNVIDARIGAGISREQPRLSEEGMARGLEAIRELAAGAAAGGAARLIVVATSAVRDAANGADFRERVRAAIGADLRILTGEEEAGLIGRGLLSDPALRGKSDFTVCDLGGGSLECVAFKGRRVRAQVSLPLGCVRLTERFVADPTAPVPADTLTAVATHVRATLGASGFTFTPPGAKELIGTGGTISTARRIVGRRQGLRFEESDPAVPLPVLRALLAEVAASPLAVRSEMPGLAAARADVFPAALATVVAVLEYAGAVSFRHSLRNLRHGVAAEALGVGV